MNITHRNIILSVMVLNYHFACTPICIEKQLSFCLTLFFFSKHFWVHKLGKQNE